MARRAKYPTPEEARSRFETGVELAKEKYARRAREGADDYQLWFTGFAAKIYPLIAGLPDPEGKDIKSRVEERVTPVSEGIHKLSQAYRKAKRESIAKKYTKAAEALLG